MNEFLTFDDVLICPKFSHVASRKDVDLSGYLWDAGQTKLPIISANMDTITGPEMAFTMAENGAVGCLHRFWSIEENIKAFQESVYPNMYPMVSIGLGRGELERAEALYKAGAKILVVDVAHGAQMGVVSQVAELQRLLKDNVWVIVGNFASSQSIKDFKHHLGMDYVSGWKIGVGPGSACTTRIKTGVGIPQLSAILDCAKNIPGEAIIADGGIRTPGDVAKALGAGADLVMLGGMLAGTTETPGQTIYPESLDGKSCPVKRYRGSASKESYQIQGKDAGWRTAEGESFLVPCKGSIEEVLREIEGGLRSSLTYVGASNLEEFKQKVEFVKVSSSTIKENGAHGIK